jgi:hypothetical protein
MSRKMVRVGVFVLVASFAMVVTRIYGDEPQPKPAAGGDDPFGSGRSPAAEAKPMPKSPPKLHGGEKAILKALRRQATLEFVEVPLKDILDHISEKYRIPIVRDASGLKDAGVDLDTPVTCHLSGISLQSALEIMLDELQLKWVIHKEVLIITSPQKAESDEFMYTKIYGVADLVIPIPNASVRDNPLATPDAMRLEGFVRPSPQQPIIGGLGGVGGGAAPAPKSLIPVVGFQGYSMGGVAANIGYYPPAIPNDNLASHATVDFKPLMDLIQNTIAQKSWVDNGGNGTISDFPTTLSLAISQTREVHQEIDKLLADLRARKQGTPLFQVELHWLWLDKAHREALLVHGKQTSARDRFAVDRQRLLRIAQDVPGFHAIANCMNGQNAAITAGDRRALIVSAIPVTDGGVGYQPVISVPNVGVVADVAPIRLPGTNMARVTVNASITRWTPNRGPAKVGAAWGPGSRVNADATQSPASSSAVAPSSQPVMGIGGTGIRGMGGMGMGGGFMQVARENVRTVAPATPPSNAPVPQPKGGFGDFLPPAQPATTTTNGSTNSLAHTSISSHGGGSSSCPIDLPVMPTQEFGTTLRVPLGKPVVVGSVTFAPAGGAGVGEAKKDAMEVYLIATTSVVKKAAKAKP